MVVESRSSAVAASKAVRKRQFRPETALMIKNMSVRKISARLNNHHGFGAVSGMLGRFIDSSVVAASESGRKRICRPKIAKLMKKYESLKNST